MQLNIGTREHGAANYTQEVRTFQSEFKDQIEWDSFYGLNSISTSTRSLPLVHFP